MNAPSLSQYQSAARQHGKKQRHLARKSKKQNVMVCQPKSKHVIFFVFFVHFVVQKIKKSKNQKIKA